MYCITRPTHSDGPRPWGLLFNQWSREKDDNFEPYVKFKYHWEEEVKKAGSVDKAGLRHPSFRSCCTLMQSVSPTLGEIHS